MKITNLLPGLALLFAASFSAAAQTITTTPTNGPTTITVHARTKDGKVPVGGSDCKIDPGTWPADLANGDLTVTNVPPGTYQIFLFSSNYVTCSHSRAVFRIFAGTNYTVDFVLSNGATFKGRVLDDATGKPIADVPIHGITFSGSGAFDDATDSDAEGHYQFLHVSGSLHIRLFPETNYYVPQLIEMDEAAEDSTVSIPDVRFQRGGRLSGLIERPAEVDSYSYTALFQGTMPTNCLIDDGLIPTGGTFHTFPLPPGTYTLHAQWQKEPTWPPFEVVDPQDALASGIVSNITVIAGQETTNVVIPTRMIVQTNRTGGR
jgi:hypothetical protein